MRSIRASAAATIPVRRLGNPIVIAPARNVARASPLADLVESWLISSEDQPIAQMVEPLDGLALSQYDKRTVELVNIEVVAEVIGWFHFDR